MIKRFWYKIIFTPTTFVALYVLLSGFVFGMGIKNINQVLFIIIACLIITYTLTIIKPIRKKLFYLYFQKIHIKHMDGNLNSRYNKILINKFPNSLELIVDIQTHISNGVCKNFDYLKYSKDIKKIVKYKNQERDILLFVQKLNLVSILNQESKEKLKIFNRKEKIKSIL